MRAVESGRGRWGVKRKVWDSSLRQFSNSKQKLHKADTHVSTLLSTKDHALFYGSQSSFYKLIYLSFLVTRLEDQKFCLGSSLVAQSLRILLLMQGTRVRSLVREDPTCRGATKPVCYNYWACALEPASHNYWAHAPQLWKPVHSRARVPQLLNLHAATAEACTPRARAPQQEKPPQWEARAPQWRVAPAHHN